MEEEIEGKVAAIIDNQIIVINRGDADGVRNGMTFAIFTVGEKINDPVTGETLGNFEIIKAKIEVVHVMEKMCSAIQIPVTDMVDLIQAKAIGKRQGSIDCEVEIGDSVREYIGMPQLLEFAKLFGG